MVLYHLGTAIACNTSTECEAASPMFRNLCQTQCVERACEAPAGGSTSSGEGDPGRILRCAPGTGHISKADVLHEGVGQCIDHAEHRTSTADKLRD